MAPADSEFVGRSRSHRRPSAAAWLVAAAWLYAGATPAVAQPGYAADPRYASPGRETAPEPHSGAERGGYANPVQNAYEVQPAVHSEVQVQPAAWPFPSGGAATGDESLPERGGRRLELRGDAPSAEPFAKLGKSGAAQAGGLLKDWFGAGGAEQAVKLFILSGVVSLAPALLMMTTCFVRLAVVLGMLRQALGGPPGLPTQVLTALAVFLTALIMWPVWDDVQRNALAPLSREEIDFDEAWRRAEKPLRRFMSLQIERTGNQADVWLFLRHWPDAREPKTYDDVPMAVLAPAFLLSELKTAFLIGFQIYLPFLVIDLVVAAATTSLGMLMLSPTSISLPIKILLFVVADGWNLIIGMLLTSFEAYSP